MIRVLTSWLRRHATQLILGGSLGLLVWFAAPSQALAWSPNENTCMGVNPSVATQVVSCGISRGYDGAPNGDQWNVHFNLWLPPNTTAVSMGDSFFDDFGLVQVGGGSDNRTYTGQTQGQCGTSATGSWRPISFTPGSYVGMDLVAIDTCGSFQTATINFNITLNLSPPTIDIKADGSDGPVVSSTGSVQLSWTSTEATSCNGTGGWTPNGAVNLSGSTPAGGLGATPTTFTITCTGPNGVATDSVIVSSPPAPAPDPVDPDPVVLAPTIAYITPTSGSTLGGTVVGVGGSNFVSGTTVTVGGIAATVSAVVSGSITITTPPHAVGAVDVTVTNPDGQSATLPNAYVYTDLTTSSHGVTLTCGPNDAGKQLTETFESFVDGQTKDFGWQVVTPEQSSITVRKDIGKSGNGLELADSNTTVGATGVPYAVRAIKSSEQGSVSFDIQPKQTTGRFTTMLAGAKGTMMYVYLAPDGTLQAWNDAVTTGSKYVRIGSVSYKANEWANLKLDWNAQGVDVLWNGTKVNAGRLPYSYPSNLAPVTSLSFNTGYEQSGNAFTGTYLIDNVVYPGCVSALSMTVNPTSGPMPLKVTALASVPSRNLLNDPATEVNDVGAAVGAKLARTQKDNGTIEVTNAPMAASCVDKSWIYDLDQAKGNQLQWKRTIPTNATIVARLSWDVTGNRTLQQGFVGLIDDQGSLHNVVGFNDGDGPLFGAKTSVARNYIRDPIPLCAGPTGDTWKTSETLTGPTGTTLVQIIKTGNHVKLYLDERSHLGDIGVLSQEHDLQGNVAGVAFATDGLPTLDYGTMRLESLTLTDDTLTWDFGDGSAKVTGAERFVEHTYTKAGDFELALTADGQTVKQIVKVTAVDPVVAAAVVAATPEVAVTPVGGGDPPAAPATKPASLVSTGGSLAVNLGIAFLLSILTGYFILRRHHPDSSQSSN